MSDLREPKFSYNQLSGHFPLPADDHLVSYGDSDDEDGVFASHKAEIVVPKYNTSTEVWIRVTARDSSRARRFSEPDHDADAITLTEADFDDTPLFAVKGIGAAAIIAIGLWIGTIAGYVMFMI